MLSRLILFQWKTLQTFEVFIFSQWSREATKPEANNIYCSSFWSFLKRFENHIFMRRGKLTITWQSCPLPRSLENKVVCGRNFYLVQLSWWFLIEPANLKWLNLTNFLIQFFKPLPGPNINFGQHWFPQLLNWPNHHLHYNSTVSFNLQKTWFGMLESWGEAGWSWFCKKACEECFII